MFVGGFLFVAEVLLESALDPRLPLSGWVNVLAHRRLLSGLWLVAVPLLLSNPAVT